MTKKNAAKIVDAPTRRNEVMPAGAIRLEGHTTEGGFNDEVKLRAGSDRVKQGPDAVNEETGERFPVFAVLPASANSKRGAEYGPFVTKCRETGRAFILYTYAKPDKDGIFTPVMFDIWPPILAERIDEAQQRQARLPDWLKTANRGN